MMAESSKSEKGKQDKHIDWKEELPLIPLRNMVVFPQMIVPLFIGRSRSVKALEETIKKERMVVFASQLKEDVEEPISKDIASIGTLAEIVQIMEMPDATTKILVEGIARVRIEDFSQDAPFFRVHISRISEAEEVTVEVEALIRQVIRQFETYVKLNKKIPSETLMSIINVESPTSSPHIYPLRLKKSRRYLRRWCPRSA
jgi:ATP-dependent Lon protease